MMRKEVHRKCRFDEPARIMFALAELFARDQKKELLECSHVFAAGVLLHGETLRKLLGREITRLPENFRAGKDRIASFIRTPVKGTMDFSQELGMMFLEENSGSPFRMFHDYLAESRTGPAAILAAMLLDPTEEIADILLENGFSNDAGLLENLVRENFLTHLRDFVSDPPPERLARAAEMGEKFESAMTAALRGQDRAAAEISSALTDFWYNGNGGRPLVILLLSKAGGGRSCFAARMQETFVGLGLQSKVEPPLDMSSFVHDMSCDADLLGDARSYRNARSGKLYEMARVNRRGMMVFEDILGGSRNAKNILRSFARNLAYDKYNEVLIQVPFNVLVFTMKITDDQYRFIREKSGKGVTAKLLNELFAAESEKDPSVSVRPDASALESSGLWECADRIVLLEQLAGEKLEMLAADELERIGKRLKEDYRIEFRCSDIPRFIRLLLLSFPNEAAPGELLEAVRDAFAGMWRTLSRNRSIGTVEVECAPLPDYPHDPERRTIRGDHLQFRRTERIDGKRLCFSFDEIRYTQQERVDCGDYRIERPKGTGFDDLVGVDDVRDELLDALDFITNRDEYGVKTPPPCLNFILHGPPGTGKTSIAVALANSADIPVFFASSSIFTHPAKLRAMFRKAADMAPAIVVLDEFNSIGDAGIVWKRDAVNELLAILDGVQKNSRLLVLASTNHLDQIEPALLRSGRFGRQLLIGLPTPDARRAYIRKFEAEFGFTLTDGEREKFVDETDQVSIADIKGMLGFALRSSIRSGGKISGARLSDAVLKFKRNHRKTGIGFSQGV